MHTFICSDSIDGILTGVYQAFSSKLPHSQIRLSTREPDNYELFTEYHTVAPDSCLAAKVVESLKKRFGQEFYETIYEAAMSDSTSSAGAMDKAYAIYRTIYLAFIYKSGTKVLLALGEPCVYRVFELCRGTSREAMHLLGFTRFQELKNQLLIARIHPKNHVLPILGEHFSNRLPEENFIIFDENRRLAVIHPCKKSFFITDTTGLQSELLEEFSTEEQKYQQLWLTFFESVAIQSRCNKSLQSQLIPKRFQADAIEFTISKSPQKTA